MRRREPARFEVAQALLLTEACNRKEIDMRNLRLSAAALFLLTGLVLAAPLAALPPDCEMSCKCTSRCTQVCFDGGVIRCGDWGICSGTCFAAAEKTASPDSLRDAIFAAASLAANQPRPVVPAK
jgi:hypothetical protein